MKKLILLFTLFAICVNAQIIHGKILSKETKERLSYISIFSDDNTYLTLTDSVGNFSFQKSEKINEIFIDTQGYEFKKINLKEVNYQNLEILLQEEIIQLNEVAISTSFNKKIKVGNSGSSVHVDFNPISDENRIREIAVRLNAKSLAKIDKVNLGFSKLPKNTNTTFRLTIYDEKDERPNKMISKEDLLYEINETDLNNKVFSISLKNKNIMVNGVFYVSVEVYNELKETIWFSAGFLGRNGYLRRNYNQWDKMPMKISPYINVELLLKNNL